MCNFTPETINRANPYSRETQKRMHCHFEVLRFDYKANLEFEKMADILDTAKSWEVSAVREIEHDDLEWAEKELKMALSCYEIARYFERDANTFLGYANAYRTARDVRFEDSNTN